MPIAKDQLERIQAWASIASAIAIPVVLAVVGYYVQRQLADEGLKKDYVSIAAGILKDSPAGQEPDLRTWAVTVLDANSPIPFSKKAKESLVEGKFSIVVSGARIPPPIERCMEMPAKTNYEAAFLRLIKSTNAAESKPRLDAAIALLAEYGKFAEAAVAEHNRAEMLENSFDCIRKQYLYIYESDNRSRMERGEPDAKVYFEQLDRERAARLARPSASSASR